MDEADLKRAEQGSAAAESIECEPEQPEPAGESGGVEESAGVAQAAEPPEEQPAAAGDSGTPEAEAGAAETAVVRESAEGGAAEAAAVEGGAGAEAPAEAAPETEAPPHIDLAALKPVVEAIVYVAEEPVTAEQLAKALDVPEVGIKQVLEDLTAEFADAAHGVMIREVAGGYKMATKAEHHETVRTFAKSLKPPLKLSLAALETLATIAYKQPITAPEIMEIRGVQGAGVLKTLLDRKLIQTGGRKNVIGRPILYRTTKEFLMQFGLKDLAELPTLKEFEELRRLAITEDETTADEATAGEGEAPSSESASEAPATEAEAPAPEAAAEASGADADPPATEAEAESAAGSAEPAEEPDGESKPDA